MIIRIPEVKDSEGIAKVQYEAWKSAYGEIMPAEFVKAMDVDVYTKNWHNALSKKGKGKYLVVEEGGEIIAFCTFGPARDEDLNSSKFAEIVAINVHPSHWRKSVGSKLLKSIFMATKSQYKFICLWVADENQQAKLFYENFGFNPDGNSKNIEQHGNIKEIRYVCGVC